METSIVNNSGDIIVVIKFYNGEFIKICCSGYLYDEHTESFRCYDENKELIFIAPIDRILCAYEDKYRISE